MKRFLSSIASIALSVNLFASSNIKNYVTHTNYNAYVKKRQDMTNKQDIEIISNIIYLINQKSCEALLNQDTCNITTEERQNLRKLIKLIDKVIYMSHQQIKNNKSEIDEKVYYSSLAFKDLLESFLNDEYMQVTGGFVGLFEKFDCVEYGKQVAIVKERLS